VASRHTTQTELAEYAEADYIGVPSGFARQSFLDRGVPERKLLCIPYGVDLSAFRPEPKRDNVFRIVHCGGITFRKGVHHLVQAFSEMSQPEAELWLIGSRSTEIDDYLEAHRCSGLVLRGTFPQATLLHEFAQASVFTLASLEEGLALVIPQAMACGIPVICSTNTGGADIVRDGQDGFIFPAGDVEALKSHLRWSYDHQDRLKQMGQSALERVQTGFSWNDYGDRIEAAYQKVLARR
jgi:glycosyltransferase involved in cell wall biosynthesis